MFPDTIEDRLSGAGLRTQIRLRRRQCRRIAERNDQRFYCRALSGESDYNICVNSDLTVSCNCQDYDGSGQIGDLKTHTLPEIFAGPRARSFRETLAQGRFPVFKCAGCKELRFTDEETARRRIEEFSLPVLGIMVENTALCNFKCIGCRGEWTGIRSSARMSMEDIRLVSGIIHEHGIRHMSFFNLGEPFLAGNILEQISLIKEENPGITISCSTNGALVNSDEKRAAAELMDVIAFSIHGASQEALVKYQRTGNFQRQYGNMKALADRRRGAGRTKPDIRWKYLTFNWNDGPREIERAVELAKDAGVDSLYFWATVWPFFGVSWRFRRGRMFQDLLRFGVPESAMIREAPRVLKVDMSRL